jgi:hypothetical protein
VSLRHEPRSKTAGNRDKENAGRQIMRGQYMKTYVRYARRVNGGNLRRLLHGKSMRQRAQAAAKLVAGELQLVDPNPAQAARLCEVNPTYVHAELNSDGYVDNLI